MTPPVLIVGAGLSGLACARHLHRLGIPFRIFEASDRPGGRMKTDLVQGFRLDRGFQVHFSAYPTASAELDERALSLKRFEPGAHIWLGGDRTSRVMRDDPMEMALSRLFTLGDKFRILSLSRELAESGIEDIRSASDVPASIFFEQYGFSSRFIEQFARPFFGGIFLDRDLQVSSRQLLYIWKMLNEGETVLPELGIEEIPRQIASGLPAGLIVTHSPVSGLTRVDGQVKGAKLADGTQVEGSAVVLATEAPEAARLSGIGTIEGSKSSLCLYFAAPKKPYFGAYISLNAKPGGLINEVVPMSNVSPKLAPKGQELISATIVGDPKKSEKELMFLVRGELAEWFPLAGTANWRHLKTYRVEYAQMPQPAGVFDRLPAHATPIEGLYFGGEFTTHSSIDGALQAGIGAANTVSQRIGAPVAV